MIDLIAIPAALIAAYHAAIASGHPGAVYEARRELLEYIEREA